MAVCITECAGVSMRCRSPECVACGSAPAITAASLPSYDYAAFTGQAAANDGPPAPLRLLSPEQRLTPEELRDRSVGSGRCSEGSGPALEMSCQC